LSLHRVSELLAVGAGGSLTRDLAAFNRGGDLCFPEPHGLVCYATDFFA
jgi:hypothetical protein